MALGEVPFVPWDNVIPSRCGLCPENLLESSRGLGCTASPHRQSRGVKLQMVPSCTEVVWLCEGQSCPKLGWVIRGLL